MRRSAVLLVVLGTSVAVLLEPVLAQEPAEQRRGRAARRPAIEAGEQALPACPMLELGSQIETLSGNLFLDLHENLELTEAQVYHLNLVRLKHESVAAAQLASMEALRNEILDLLLSESFDPAAVNAKAAELAKAHEAQLRSSLDALETSRKLLRPEQWKSWQELLARRYRGKRAGRAADEGEPAAAESESSEPAGSRKPERAPKKGKP